jgi:SAM-dependent methyltransferase
VDKLRYQRETDFHDKVFGADQRRDLEKFYSVTQASKRFFRQFLIEHCEGKHVLEYGCGPHSQAVLFSPRGATTFSIDISPVAISLHRDLVSGHGLARVLSCVMNAEYLGFVENSFDLICGTGILHHLDLERSFAELRRTLRPAGSAIFLEPLGHNPLINAYRKLTPKMRSDDEHPLMMADFRVAEKYFRRIEIRYFHLLSLGAFIFRRARWFQPLVRQLDRIDQNVFCWFPFMRKHAWAAAIILGEPKK